MNENKQVKHTQVNLYDFFFANKTRKTYTNIGVSLILILVLVVFALRPTIVTIGTIKEKIKEYEGLNQKLEAKITASRRLQQQVSQTSANSPIGLKDEITFMNTAFQSKDSIKDVYKNIQARSIVNNVAIVSITPRPIVQTLNNDFEGGVSSPSQINFELNIEIEAKDILSTEKFISSLEGYGQFPVPSRVRSVVINNLAESAKAGFSSQTTTTDAPQTIVMSITMLVYIDETRAPQLLIGQ